MTRGDRRPSRRRRRPACWSALAVVLLAASSVPAPATAHHGPACGGSWSKSGACTFTLNGTPLTVSASTDGGGMHARIEVLDAGVEVLGCRVDDAGPSSCTAEAGSACVYDTCPPVHVGPALATARCVVDGAGAGAFWCASGRGF